MTDTTQVTEAIHEHSRSFFTRALTFVLALPLRIALRPLLWLPRIAAGIILIAVKRAFGLLKLALSLPIPGQSGRRARGVVAGAAAGAGAALLLDPDSGPKRREMLRERGMQAGQQAANLATQKVREARGETSESSNGAGARHTESESEPESQNAPQPVATETPTATADSDSGPSTQQEGRPDTAAETAEAMADTPAGGGGA